MANRITSAITLAMVLTVSGCAGDGGFQGRKIDYKSAKDQGYNPLEKPPDIIGSYSPEIVNADRESITFSTYSIETLPNEVEVLPEVGEVSYQRSGNLRWVETDISPEKAWPIVQKFWQELGFALETDSPETGIIETNWLQNRAKISGVGLTGLLDTYLERVHDTGERDKFRTRIEKSAGGGTEIYVTHRSVAEVLESGGYTFRRLPSDPSLEVEIMRQLMLFFDRKDNVDRGVINQEIAQAEQQTGQPDAYQRGDDWLLIPSTFEQGWRTIGLALDRAGFTIEDRDRSLRSYFIRYAWQEEEEEGVLDAISDLFSEEEADIVRYRIDLESNGPTETRVTFSQIGVSSEEADLGEITPKIVDLIVRNI